LITLLKRDGMGGGARKYGQERGDAVNHAEDEATSNETTTEQRGGDETGADEQGGGDSSQLGAMGSEATPSAGSRNCRPVRPGKDVNKPRAENDDTLEIGNVDSPSRNEGIADDPSLEGADVPLEDVEDDVVVDEVEEVPDAEEADETPVATANPRADEKADERSMAAADPGAVAVAKAVRRLSFSSGGGNEPKKLKTSSGRAKELRKTPKKKPVSKTKKAGLVFPVSRVYNRLKKDRYANRVRVNAAVYLAATLEYLVAEVLELAGNCARYFKKKRVTPRHIQLTLLHDLELKELTKGVIVPEGGVKENNIHKELLPKNSARSYTSEEDRRHDSEI